VVESIPAELKAAVATGGISWETVVEAATEAALEVAMVWAWARAAREAATRIWYCMVAVVWRSLLSMQSQSMFGYSWSVEEEKVKGAWRWERRWEQVDRQDSTVDWVPNATGKEELTFI
jgi:hypothetical protein